MVNFKWYHSPPTLAPIVGFICEYYLPTLHPVLKCWPFPLSNTRNYNF